MRFADFLMKEMLDQTSAYEWEPLNNEDFRTYTTFFELEDESQVKVFFTLDAGSWEIEFSRDGDFTLTGRGDTVRIFATLIEIIQAFVNAEDPPIMHFSAKRDEASRVRFYKRVIKKIETMGFKLVLTAEDTENVKVAQKIAMYQKYYPSNSLFILEKTAQSAT